jgi:hypothetical protein
LRRSRKTIAAVKDYPQAIAAWRQLAAEKITRSLDSLLDTTV